MKPTLVLCAAAVICSTGCGPTQLQLAQEAAENHRHEAELRAIDARYKKIVDADNAHLAIGSSELDAMGAWGFPDHVNTTALEHGKREQWVYEDLGYLYFENGRLVAIQRSN